MSSRDRLLIFLACLPLFTVLVMLPTTVREAKVLDVGPSFVLQH